AFLTLVIGFNVIASPPRMSVAGSVVLGVALVCVYFPVTQMVRLPRTMREADAAAEEVLLFLDRSPGVGQYEQAKPLERLRQSIEFHQVTVADRDGRKLLDNVS